MRPAELAILPFPWERALVPPSPYRGAREIPRAPLAEFPFYGGRVACQLHTQYMVVLDHALDADDERLQRPYAADFRTDSFVLDSFPSNDSFRVLQRARVRYIGVHWDMFGPRADEIRQTAASRTPPTCGHWRRTIG